MKNLIILHLLFSFGISQRVQLFTKTDDIFTSANHFTIKNKRVIFWEDRGVLMTVPVKNLVEVRYAEKSYAYVGSPCVFIGALTMASTVGLAVAGQINTAYASNEELIIGLGGGLAFYSLGKLLKLIGARVGRDSRRQLFS